MLLFVTVFMFFINSLLSQFIVELDNGLIEGHVVETDSDNRFVAYEGIPYAQPPVGINRFADPKLARPWKGVWKANLLHTCLQYDHFGANVTGDEDCLYLNVYTPLKKSPHLLDVIVHVHGGAFMFGYGHRYGPYFLLDDNNDVIFVNLNYRLGVFGFLSTEDEVLPGNLGMKDQVVALKWIQKNIKYFGGNPESVTLTGMSAGGASVHLHYLSPLSKGLFKQGMAISGCALNPWVMAENSFEKAKKLAVEVGCPTGSSKLLVDCLRNRPALQLVTKTRLFMPWLYNPFSPFGVVIEPQHENAFLSEHPYVLLSKKQFYDVPLIFSFTQSEGLYPAAEFVSNPNYLEFLEKHWYDYAPHVLDFNNTLEIGKHPEISKQTKEFYLKKKAISNETFGSLVQMIGDRLFVTDILNAARLHNDNSKSSVYLYHFAYRGQTSKSSGLSGDSNDYGVSHGDDMIYVLLNATQKKSEEDFKMASYFVEFWISYAANGKPKFDQSEWRPIAKRSNFNLDYLEIRSANQIEMKKMDKNEILTFWNSLPFRENKFIDKTNRIEL